MALGNETRDLMVIIKKGARVLLLALPKNFEFVFSNGIFFFLTLTPTPPSPLSKKFLKIIIAILPFLMRIFRFVCE
jgi:hypothetical protein